MALETVTAIIAGISGNDETRRLIAAQALDKSQIDRLKPAVRLTSPVVRGAFASEIEAYAVAEGSTKTLASGVSNAVNYQVQAIAIMIPVSNLLFTSQDDLKDAIVGQLIAGLARGIDRTILRDSESVFGYSVTGAASAASNTTAAASATAITYAEMSTAFGLVEADGYSPSGVVVREGNKAALRTQETTAGSKFWSPADNTVFGVPTVYVKSNGSLPVLPQSGTTGEVMAVVGDWDAGLHWGMYGDFTIDANPWAYDYFSTNQVLVRAEVFMGFAILNNNAFGTLLEP